MATVFQLTHQRQLHDGYTLTQVKAQAHTVFRMHSRKKFACSGYGFLRKVPSFNTVVLLWLALMPVAPLDAEDTMAPLHRLLSASCEAPFSSLAQMAAQVPGSTAIAEEPLVVRGVVIGWQRRFRLPQGAEIKIERIAPRAQLRRVVAEYWAAVPGGSLRPELAVVADASCTIRLGRRLLYNSNLPQPTAIEHLDRTLAATGVREPLNPPVPEGKDPGGIPVAMVDAGVNYLLPEIDQRLARDENGEILGYDYWDMDRRPFDANPARSPFFPQRHGTTTAALLVREAPMARLVPYRYPRPNMSRMTELIRDAAAKGIVVVNMSMGSNKRDDWGAFAAAARAHSQMLFVVSAGNDGRDIDAQPVYPAALQLENVITVTSSETTGALARGSNWGRRSVDLLVPGERLTVTNFNGRQALASGSSYAAVRIAALAVRLLVEHPEWRGTDVRTAILARAMPPYLDGLSPVAHGFIPDPASADARPPSAQEPLQIVEKRALPLRNFSMSPYSWATAVVGLLIVFAVLWLNLTHQAKPARDKLGLSRLPWVTMASSTLVTGLIIVTLQLATTTATSSRSLRYVLQPSFAYFEQTRWNPENIRTASRRAANIFEQCNITMPQVDLYLLRGQEKFRYFLRPTADELVRDLPLPKPTVYFLRVTLHADGFEAEAIGRSNSGRWLRLVHTVWVTEEIRDPGIGLAHELAHILMDSGEHVDWPRNLMRAETSPENVELTHEQCRQLVRAGLDNGLLTPLR
jgi:hypothetical protein